MYLFELASRHMNWLADRQSVTAANIANADTPGYRAKDAGGFDIALSQTRLEMMATEPAHILAAADSSGLSVLRQGTRWDEAHSGNNVSLEAELLQANQTSRMMGVDTAIARSFHRMLLTSLKV